MKDDRHGRASVLWVTSDASVLPTELEEGTRVKSHLLPRAGWWLWRAWRFWRQSFSQDVLLLHFPRHELVCLLCLLRAARVFGRARLVVVDVILSRPGTSWAERAKHAVKRLLMPRADLFVFHFKEWEPIELLYRIPRSKMWYTPYHVPGWELVRNIAVAEGDQVFTGGRSRRDYTTFCKAMAVLPYPGLISVPPPAVVAQHGTWLDRSIVSSNVQVVHDDGSLESWMRQIAQSRLVVLCTHPDALSASGLSTYLLAMALKKCVIITESLTTRGVLEHEQTALLVPAGDADSLKSTIQRVWEDDACRNRIATQGREYALAAGSEETMFYRILNHVVGSQTATRPFE